MKEKEVDYFVEVVEMKKGQTLGKLLIETGKLRSDSQQSTQPETF